MAPPIPFALLLMAIVLGFYPRRAYSLAALAISLGCALAFGTINWIAVASVAVLAFSLWWPKWRPFGLALFLVEALALSAHKIPGFQNLLLLDHVQLASDSIPYTMYFNYDKAIVGLMICLFWLKPEEKKISLKDILLVLKFLTPLAAVLLALALAFHYVRFDPKFPASAWLWMVNNFFFVCLAEEGFFRGFLQKGLCNWMPTTAALILASLLFGLAHIQGGLIYVGLASVAGLFYGLIYQRTGRILTSMLLHFGLNLIHFLAFSYPALQR